MQVRSTGWRSELLVRRAAGSEIEDHGSWLVVRTCSNPGFWWGNHLVAPEPIRVGQAPLWRRRFAETFPDAQHFALGVDDPAGRAGDPHELEQLGVEVEVSTVLSATPAEVAASTASQHSGSRTVDAAIRLLSGDSDWNQLLTLRAAVDEQAVPPEQAAAHEDYRQKRVEEDRGLVEHGNGAWFGAFTSDGLRAALGLVRDNSDQARFQTVETHPAHRRRGLARALVLASARPTTAITATTTLVIVADPEYHAIDLYRSIGFHEAGHLVQLQSGSR